MSYLVLRLPPSTYREGEIANGLFPAKSSAREEMLTLLKFVKSDVTPPSKGGRGVESEVGRGGKDNCRTMFFWRVCRLFGMGVGCGCPGGCDFSL